MSNQKETRTKNAADDRVMEELRGLTFKLFSDLTGKGAKSVEEDRGTQKVMKRLSREVETEPTCYAAKSQ